VYIRGAVSNFENQAMLSNAWRSFTATIPVRMRNRAAGFAYFPGRVVSRIPQRATLLLPWVISRAAR
jgi:hypothetical protein